jgi:hypothetical protein
MVPAKASAPAVQDRVLDRGDVVVDDEPCPRIGDNSKMDVSDVRVR